jgi:hypothetical protein
MTITMFVCSLCAVASLLVGRPYIKLGVKSEELKVDPPAHF